MAGAQPGALLRRRSRDGGDRPRDGIYPCGRVGRDDPNAPNAIESGAKQAFRDVLRPTDCASCWCTLTLSNCYAYKLDPRLLEGRLGRATSNEWEALAPPEIAAASIPNDLVAIRRNRSA